MNRFPPAKPAAYTVSDLTRYLRVLLELDDVLNDVWVQGEVSNVSRPSSGHIYFTLKDAGAAMQCVVWRSSSSRLKVTLQNGMAIEAHGAISVYEKDGKVQLYVDAARPAGEGQLYQEFLRLKARLEAEGLFNEERKRPLPARPRCIGVVTSASGAALQDILNTLQRRYPLVEVILSPCAVQGEAAPAEIVAALQALEQLSEPDVIILARGGGSLEDLWAFNDERVVRAVAFSRIPVVTGVGHETDFTLVDFASDVRAPTPTGAATLVTPDQADLRVDLSDLYSRLSMAALGQVDYQRQLLTTLAHQLERVTPMQAVRNERQQVDSLSERARRAFAHQIELRGVQLKGAAQRLNALNPLSILQRGFALIEQADGSLAHGIDSLQVGQTVHIRMADGQAAAQIQSTERTSLNSKE